MSVSLYALSGIALQNVTQIDHPCDSKCHMRSCAIQKMAYSLTKALNITADGNRLNAIVHSSIIVSSIQIPLVQHIFSF